MNKEHKKFYVSKLPGFGEENFPKKPIVLDNQSKFYLHLTTKCINPRDSEELYHYILYIIFVY